ncbi:MAG: hypothetical protein KIS76_00280 [Pyrinomonadaceae bacterium]|nr:hypothetical protein [Pyrinomonadaceae bacterium]
MSKRPPPYFPQTALNPTDDNRYKKFKMVAAGSIIVILALLIAAGIGIYYFIVWLF